MGRRGKVVVARINNENQRKASMRKRTTGLLKKVREITTLCGTEAAVVIYKPDDNQPTVWPSTSAAKATISDFLSRPDAERTANSHTAKSFMEEQCRKKKEKAQRLIKINEERNIQALITSIYEGKTRIQDLDAETKEKLSDFTDQKIEEIRNRVQRLKKEQQAPHSPQVLSPAVQMPRVSQATSGLTMDGRGAGRNFQSPAAAHGQLMDVGGMTQSAPALTWPLPTPNLCVMSPNLTTGYRLDVTGAVHGQRNVGGITEREALSLAQRMPSVSQVASGLRALNINDLAGGGNFPFLAAAAHGQDLNLRGMTQADTSPLFISRPILNPLAMPLNNSGTNRPDMAGGLYGQTTTDGTTQLSLFSSFSTTNTEGSVPDMTDHSLINASTRKNTYDMTGRLYEQTNIGGMMQHSIPSPLQSMKSGLHTTDNGLNNAGSRTFTGDGTFGEVMQHAPPYLLPEPPHQLGRPPIQYDASGSNMSGDEYNRTTIGFSTPATRALDLSNFGDDYGWDADEFLGPLTNPLDQRNFTDVFSDGEWDDQ